MTDEIKITVTHRVEFAPGTPPELVDVAMDALRRFVAPAPPSYRQDKLARIENNKLRWTEARDALLKRDYPAGVLMAAILRGLRALPADLPVDGGLQVAGRASVLGLRRPAGWGSGMKVALPVRSVPHELAAGRDAFHAEHGFPEALAVENIDTAEAEPPAPTEAVDIWKVPGALRWTRERDEMLRRDYPGGVPMAVLLPALQALPGAPVSSQIQVSGRASDLHIARPSDWKRRVAAEARELRREKQAQEIPSPALVAPQAKAFGRAVAVPETTAAKLAKALPPATAPRRPVGPMRTPEREAKLREFVEARRGIHFTATALNILPGPTMLSHDVVMWIDELGLTPDAVDPVGVARTFARARVLTAAFAAGDPVEHIAAKLHHLDGAPIDAAAVRAWIADLRLKRTVLSDKVGGQDSKAPKLYPIDFNSAVRWAQDHRVPLPRGCSDATAQELINQVRTEQGLRCWQLTEPRGRRVAV